MTTNENQSGTIKDDGRDQPRTTVLRYLGSLASSDGRLTCEIIALINAAWLKWRSMSGVLCNWNIPDHLKSKIYRTMLGSVALYGAECWHATKEVEHRLGVMETKMLCWMAGFTRLDRICNNDIRQRFGVAKIAEKLREARLRWCGHVLRADDETVFKIGPNLDVPGKRSKGARSAGSTPFFPR